MKKEYRNKEISWLSFNARLLQEAADASVPLLERFKFLGIFSSNLDEFFRVRVATLKRLEKLGKKSKQLIGHNPGEILQDIHSIVLTQQATFEHVYQKVLKELAQENIFIIQEDQINDAQTAFIRAHFRQHIFDVLNPLMIDQMDAFPELNDYSIYLAVHMWRADNPKKFKYALIEVPTAHISRFVILPKTDEKQYIILLDDVIRFNLDEIFFIFKYDRFQAYTIKLTRDAELDLDNDFSESLLKKMAKGLNQRKSGQPVRFIFDHEIPADLLKYLIKKIHPDQVNSSFIPGSRYHNFKDFISFPKVGGPHLRYQPITPLPHPLLPHGKSLFKCIEKQDILLNYPYQTFDHIIDLLREAAIDPHVKSIDITVYRLAKNSKVVNALVNAVKNGKKVTVVMELKARFDEEANIRWAREIREEGIRVIYSSSDFKVHAKMILITRKSSRKTVYYANIGTGNFNETTARLYTDHALLTADPRLTLEVKKVFETLEHNYARSSFRHLLVAPFNMRQKWTRLIETEIANANSGKDARIIVKTNNLTDPTIIKYLYKASNAGVKIRLMIRGMFSVMPGVPEMSENIEATGTIDKFLEHTRIFVFANDGNEQIYLSSADWMPRNLNKRIEVACPVYDQALKTEILDYLDIHWRENVKARVLDETLANHYKGSDSTETVRAQSAL